MNSLFKVRELGWVKAKTRIRGLLYFTNGCFDILHPGHVEFLYKCQQYVQGGFLVVGLNSDSSVKALKGCKPVMDVAARATLLSLHPAVDDIIIFNEKTPTWPIKYLKPKMIFHGHSKERPAWDSGATNELEGFEGRVVRIPIVTDWSSSLVKERVVADFFSRTRPTSTWDEAGNPLEDIKKYITQAKKGSGYNAPFE